ncbi:unnamed protein product [Calicophoron daubneyi]|uniref:Uncharacterized protein n=1 Tax=Calicophoron daubneyi TaxID=300641 RepID=A0AAV2TIE0_CALDB
MSSIIRKIVCTKNAPSAIGPYSQAVAAGNTLYVSGQLGLVPETGKFAGADVEAQAHQVFRNINEILKDAGATMGNVVKTTVLLADIKDFTKVNEIYEKYFVKPYPARAAYQVTALPKEAKVEVEVIACLGKIEDQ